MAESSKIAKTVMVDFPCRIQHFCTDPCACEMRKMQVKSIVNMPFVKCMHMEAEWDSPLSANEGGAQMITTFSLAETNVKIDAHPLCKLMGQTPA